MPIKPTQKPAQASSSLNHAKTAQLLKTVSPPNTESKQTSMYVYDKNGVKVYL